MVPKVQKDKGPQYPSAQPSLRGSEPPVSVPLSQSIQIAWPPPSGAVRATDLVTERREASTTRPGRLPRADRRLRSEGRAADRSPPARPGHSRGCWSRRGLWPTGWYWPPITPNGITARPFFVSMARDDRVQRPLARRDAVRMAGLDAEAAGRGSAEERQSSCETMAEPNAWATELMNEQTLRSLSTTVR